MALDPRTPVLIGAGQFLQRTGNSVDELTAALDPTALMAEAVRRAASDAGLSAVPQPDSWRVVMVMSWRHGDPGWLVARHLGLEPRDTGVTAMGGNSPQTLVNSTALEILRGDLDLAVLTGAEAARTRARARVAEVELDWPTAPPGQVARLLTDDMQMNHPDEVARGIVMPVQVYPMFETAIRAAAGRSPEEQLVRASELWARFSEVAAGNDHAWLPTARTALDIRTPGPGNRMVGLPYTKSMNSNNDVDMAAALLMCSVATAERLGVPRDRWIFPHAGTDCHEHESISHRWTFADTPAVRLGGRRALDLAGVGVDDLEHLDLYSCFPSAVQLGAASLGLPLDRQLTLTGGLSFAGGPWNNYVMHAIATMVSAIRSRGGTGLVWANGGFATKHSFGVYGDRPPAVPFRHESPQAEIDALPRRALALPDAATGPATVEAYTVMHGREGGPDTAYAACLLDDGRRAWGVSSAPDVATALCDGEWVGRRVRLSSASDLLPG